MKKIFGVFVIFSLSFLFANSVSAQVVINEFVPNPQSGNDWVEVYELPTATQSADLSQYTIDDTTGTAKSLSGSIQPGGFAFFEVSNRLNNDGDIVKLVMNGNIIDQQAYGNQGGICVTNSGESIGRYPDGTGAFVRFVSSTQGTTNNTTQNACPTPTATSTPTVAPTATPTKSPTPIPTKTATPKPTASSSPTPSPTDSPSDVLGSTDSSTSSPDPVSDGEPQTSGGSFPFIALGIILIGVGFLGFAFWPMIRAKLKRNV